MAIEKGKVSIDLEAAAADIVGFEYMPNSRAEKDAVEAAKSSAKPAKKSKAKSAKKPAPKKKGKK